MLRELFALTIEASSYQWSGKLEVANSVADLEWQFFFEMGRLVWVEGGTHPRRRYRRHFRARGLASTPGELATDSTRLLAAIAAIRAGRLTPESLQQRLRGSACEVFFDISQACSSSLQRGGHGQFAWHKNVRPSYEFVLPASWGIDACRTFNGGRRHWRKWKAAGMGRWSPDLSPTISSEASLAAVLPPEAMARATKLFVRGRTIRDVAARTRKEPREIAASLLPLVRRGSLSLMACPDLEARAAPKALEYLGTVATGATPRASGAAADEDPTAPPGEAPGYLEHPTIPPGEVPAGYLEHPTIPPGEVPSYLNEDPTVPPEASEEDAIPSQTPLDLALQMP